MFLPLGDAPNPRGTPYVNYALIAANVAVYAFVTLPLAFAAPDSNDPLLRTYLEVVAQRIGRPVPLRDLLASVSAYDLFVFRHGFRPAEPSLLALFTSMFLHGGFLHLAGNMLFLWIYGDNVEDRLGRLGYLAAYLGTGVFATLVFAAFDRGSQLPMVGASGAISGALGFYFLFFPHNRVRLLVALFPFLVDVITVPARFVLGMYLVVDNLLPFLVARGAGTGGVAHGAHLGGFVAGLGAAWWLERRERTRVPREYRTRAAEPVAEPADAAAVARLVAEGRLPEAARHYFADEGRSAAAVAPSDALALGEWLAEQGQPVAALTVFRRVLRGHPLGPLAARAHLGAGQVQLRALGRPTAAWQHFQDALDLDPTGATALAARRGLAEVEARPGRA